VGRTPGETSGQSDVGAVSDAWVYMLRCRDGSLYTGWTTDLERRLARHQAGKASRYTASRLPVELALAVPMADRTAARREEARIKRLDRAGKVALLQPAIAGSSSSSTAPSGGSSSPSAGPSSRAPNSDGSR
jgi:putative endonuclease